MKYTRVEPSIELPLAKDTLDETVLKAKDYTLMHGVSMRMKSSYNRDQVCIAPFLLVPSSFPKKEFEKAQKLQSTFNLLMHRVAHDHEFLTEYLESTIRYDELTRNLFQIYETVYAEGFTQNISLGLFRSDYMLHADCDMKIMQIELNTIAASFGGLASQISKYHKYILTELGFSDNVGNIPENGAVTGLATGLVNAWSIYNEARAVILFIVEDVTYNICDQRALEFEIRRLDPKVKVIRRSFKNLIEEEAHLGSNRELIVGDYVVSVAYYRTGYQPEAYTGADDWQLRLMIERSRAIKCPSIQYQLAGTKKIQQVLSKPHILNKFLSKKEADEIHEVFAELYSLEFNDEGDKALAMAMAEPKKFVLKPQREGGGNNVYDDNVRTVLESMRDSKERTAWILMSRINPPVQSNYLIRTGGDSTLQDLVSELGIYGIIMGDEYVVHENRQVGHVIRTKPVHSNEGGIVSGAGALDSPYLVT